MKDMKQREQAQKHTPVLGFDVDAKDLPALICTLGDSITHKTLKREINSELLGGGRR